MPIGCSELEVFSMPHPGYVDGNRKVRELTAMCFFKFQGPRQSIFFSNVQSLPMFVGCVVPMLSHGKKKGLGGIEIFLLGWNIKSFLKGFISC